MADKILKKLNIKVWRQNRASEKGRFETYNIENISTGSSFLEMMDILNNELIEKGFTKSENPDLKIITLLLELGSDPNLKNNYAEVKILQKEPMHQ